MTMSDRISYMRQSGCLHVCIESIDKKSEYVAGVISGVALEGAYEFQGLADFLTKADEIFDRIGHPQATSQPRSFLRSGRLQRPVNAHPPIYHEAEEIDKRRGSVATWNVLVRTRANSTWQGLLYDAEGTMLTAFDSEMQLLKSLTGLLDELAAAAEAAETAETDGA